MSSRLIRGGLAVVLASALTAQTPLRRQDFVTPPEAAKPRGWWHWMSGNVSKPGITADLEWMHRVGIGGMQMFDGDLGVARYVEHPVLWMKPEWKDAFRHAGAEADRLGLEMSVATSGGWSETAGPWVTPQAAMKKIVWSETQVSGPMRFRGRLPEPPHTDGPFQGIAIVDYPSTPMVGGAPGIPRPPVHEPPPPPTLYADTLVLAHRLPDAEAAAALQPTFTSSDPAFSPARVVDGDYASAAELVFSDSGAWIQWNYAQPFAARSFTIGMPQPSSRGIPQAPQRRPLIERGWRSLDAHHPAAGYAGDHPAHERSHLQLRARDGLLLPAHPAAGAADRRSGGAGVYAAEVLPDRRAGAACGTAHRLLRR